MKETTTPRGQKALTAGDWVTVTWMTLTYFLASEFVVPVSNQLQYLLLGERLADASFAPNDWLTWATLHHHFAFAGLQALLRLALPLTATVALLQLFSCALFAAGVLAIAKALHPAYTLVASTFWLWLLVFHFVTTSLGQQYAWSFFAQPSQLAGGCMFLGMGLLWLGRTKKGVTCLLFAGWLHTNYLFMLVPVVLSELARQRYLKRPLPWRTVVFPLALGWGANLAFLSWLIISQGPQDPDGIRILHEFRSPHHYLISHWSLEHSINWCLWIAIGALPATSRWRRNLASGVPYQWAISLCITVTSVLLLWQLESSAWRSLVLWRLAFWPFVLGLVLLISEAVDAATTRRARPSLLAALALLCFLGYRNLPDPSIPLWVGGCLLAGAVGLAISSARKTGLAIPMQMTMVILCLGTAAHRQYGAQSHRQAEDDLAAWLRKHTEPSAILIAPPDMGELRITSRRALIADTKAVPMMPNDTIEWFRRLTDLTDIAPSASVDDLDKGYLSLDTSRATKLAQKYHADILVVRPQEHIGDLSGLQPLYSNKDYRVYAVRP